MIRHIHDEVRVIDRRQQMGARFAGVVMAISAVFLAALAGQSSATPKRSRATSALLQTITTAGDG